jgi:ubiquinol-cytochrome c reductase cytochrome c1 subunit
MPTEVEHSARARRVCALLATTVLAAAALVPAPARAAADQGEASARPGADWQNWHANNDVKDLPSLQRGARNFVSYCLGCHSLKYERWSRLGEDLEIPTALLQEDLLLPREKITAYMLTPMPAGDAENWFGKTPPDLSLMARARGRDYLYQYLKTFYVDPTRQTGANNLRLPTTAMPHVLAEVEGLKRAVFRELSTTGAGGGLTRERLFDHFEPLSAGRLSAAEYDAFVRDTVNFLDYVSEPTQTARRALGVWVVLFLLVFTWLAWLVKREYWKDVH